MDSAVYVSLTRQSSLLREMDLVANNIANVSTAGFKRETALFSEVVRAAAVEGGSVSMAAARVRATDPSEGDMRRTGGAFDLAIEGDGYFRIDTPGGVALTRAGAFLRSAEGELVTADGHRVLGEGDAPIFLPADAREIRVAPDGAISADGVPIGAIRVHAPETADALTRRDGAVFVPDGPTTPADGRIAQGFVERSNVSPMTEMARMIAVQRAYEMGRKLLDGEHERIRNAIRTLGGPA